jgi:hypothetical protein
MTRQWFASGLLLLALAVTARAGDKDEPKTPPPPKHPALEQLKKLSGEWVALDAEGKPTAQVVTVFRVTAAGSAVHETLFPGTAHEMVTVYHLDGKDLVLTHYCAMGNQPHLKYDPSSPDKTLRFQFAGGTNLNPEKDMHMHEGSITLTDDDHVEWSWQGYKDGKPVAQKCAMKLTRKK